MSSSTNTINTYATISNLINMTNEEKRDAIEVDKELYLSMI